MLRKILIPIVIVGAIATIAFLMKPSEPPTNQDVGAPPPEGLEPLIATHPFTLTSPAFESNGSIPRKYTCDGAGVNPPLSWSGTVPPIARSFVLIMEDPDVPGGGVFDHWLVWNIPRDVTSLAEATTPQGVQGKNSGGNIGYTGPCPPDREHRYVFKLFLLKTVLDLPEGATKAELLQKMEEQVVATGELTGRYNRQR